MANIVSSITSAKVTPDYTLGRAVALGFAKVAQEQLLARTMVGNATMKSAIIKAGLAWGVHTVTKGQSGWIKSAGQISAEALAIDAAEDLAVAVVIPFAQKLPFIGKFLGGAQSQNTVEAGAYI